ncbi:secreted protein [Beggiatoa sp. PS]|nr:secreted protein [Beggiatoa sp. PS]
MRNKNTLLAAAITATLSMMNQAVYATDLKNCDSTCNATATAVSAKTVIEVSSEGITYGSHLFGSSSGSLVLPDNTEDADRRAAVIFEIEGTINFDYQFEVELSNGAKFNDAPILVFQNGSSVSADGNPGDADVQNVSCANKNACSWTITVNSELQDKDVFYLAYNLVNVSALETPGETIKMTSNWTNISSGDPARNLEATLATSRDPLTVTLNAGTENTTRISVSTNNTEFTTNSTVTTEPEYVDANQAVFGYLTIKNNSDVSAADGTEWSLGENNKAGFNADDGIETTLTIDSGQFAASLTESSGSVYIGKRNADDSITRIAAATSVTSTTAIWELSDSDLKAITIDTLTETDTTGRRVIIIETDGSNPVNVEENPPEATLVIDYVIGQQDVTYGPTEMTAFRQDGTRCWVYNVPPPSTEGVADNLNLRITNDSSSVSGTILGTLYPMGGESTGLTNPVFTSVNLLGEGVELGPYQTEHLTADEISALGGDTPYVWWEAGNRRGSLLITSTLPKLEILVLMRDSTTKILTNLSTGAHGSACQN